MSSVNENIGSSFALSRIAQEPVKIECSPRICLFILQDVCVPLSHLAELVSKSKQVLDASSLVW